MQTKDFLAASLLLVATCGGVLVASFSYYARALMFVAMVGGAVLVDSFSVEFMSIYWYRGTTRGFEATLLDVLALSVLISSLVAPRHALGRWFWPAGMGLLGIFIAYAAGSVLFAEPYLTGLFELHKMLRAVVVFAAAAAFVRTERELRYLVFALGVGVFIETMFGLKQRFWSGMERVDGTVGHPNTLSMYLCMVAPVLAAAALSDFPRWLRTWCGAAVGAAAVCILITVSRAGIPIFIVTLLGVGVWCAEWRITARKLFVAALICIAGAVLVRATWTTLVYRFTQASLEEEYLDTKKEGRGVYLRWAAAIIDDHPYGVGLNNWSYYVSRKYGPDLGFYYEDYGDFQTEEDGRRPHAAPAHNLFALTAGELGIPGVIIFGLLWLRWLQLGTGFLWRRWSAPMHRVGVGLFFGTCGIFLQSMTEWTYRQTVILFTFSALLGVLASLTWARRHVAPAMAMREAVADESEEEVELVEPATAGKW